MAPQLKTDDPLATQFASSIYGKFRGDGTEAGHIAIEPKDQADRDALARALDFYKRLNRGEKLSESERAQMKKDIDRMAVVLATKNEKDPEKNLTQAVGSSLPSTNLHEERRRLAGAGGEKPKDVGIPPAGNGKPEDEKREGGGSSGAAGGNSTPSQTNTPPLLDADSLKKRIDGAFDSLLAAYKGGKPEAENITTLKGKIISVLDAVANDSNPEHRKANLEIIDRLLRQMETAQDMDFVKFRDVAASIDGLSRLYVTVNSDQNQVKLGTARTGAGVQQAQTKMEEEKNKQLAMTVILGKDGRPQFDNRGFIMVSDSSKPEGINYIPYTTGLREALGFERQSIGRSEASFTEAELRNLIRGNQVRGMSAVTDMSGNIIIEARPVDVQAPNGKTRTVNSAYLLIVDSQGTQSWVPYTLGTQIPTTRAQTEVGNNRIRLGEQENRQRVLPLRGMGDQLREGTRVIRGVRDGLKEIKNLLKG